MTRSNCALLLLLGAACARTTHEQEAQATGGQASPSDAEKAGAAEISCLFPLQLPEPLTGPNAAPQALMLSPPFDINLMGDSHHTAGLAATFDLNGDGVSDLFFSSDTGAASPFRLLLSAPPPNIFDYTETTCDALEHLPVGRRLFLRDLNGDKVPDFIVATNLGVRAFLNQQSGLVPVLNAVLAQYPTRVAIINLETADLNGDGRTDLVLSYGRDAAMNDAWFETGIVTFQQAPDGTLAENARAATPYMAENNPPGELSGYFAVGRFGATGQPNVVATSIGALNDIAKRPFSGDAVVAPDVVDALNQLATVKGGDGNEYLGAVGLDHFYVLDLSETPARVAFQGPLVYGGNFSHLPYGNQEFRRFFFYDIDRDGDDDFFERRDGSAHPDQPALALHMNLGGQAFAEPQLFPIDLNATAEAPFVNVGPISGLVASSGVTEASAAVYTLYPAANAAPSP